MSINKIYNKLNPKVINDNIEQFLSLEDASCEAYMPRDYLIFFKNIYAIQYEVEKNLTNLNLYEIYPKSYPDFIQEEINERIQNNLTIIDPNKIHFCNNILIDIFYNLAILLPDNLQKSIIPNQNLNLSNLVKAVLTKNLDLFEKLTQNVKPFYDALYLISVYIINPFLRVCANEISKKFNLTLNSTKTCPFCGGMPFMAKLNKEDGKRNLSCFFCNTNWEFSRLKCLYCETENQDDLSYFFIDEDSPYRIDVCENCKRYIKTVDQRKKAADLIKPLIIEDVVTLFLDVVAEKKGYKSIKEM